VRGIGPAWIVAHAYAFGDCAIGKKDACFKSPTRDAALAADAHLAIASHDNFGFVSAAFPAQGRDFATQGGPAPCDARLLTCATRGNTNTSFVGATSTWILEADSHLDWRRRAGAATGLCTTWIAAIAVRAVPVPIGTHQ
jgi:hypothetical protein